MEDLKLKRAYADTPEGQIHYCIAGNGYPLLLLHQTPQSSAEYLKMIPILAKHYKVIAMDTLGYGNSDFPPPNFEIEDYARNIYHFLNAIGIKKTHIVGNHTGGVLAIEFAASYPEMVDKLILSGIAASKDPDANKALIGTPTFTFHGMDDDGEFLVKKWQTYRSFCSPGAKPSTWYPAFIASLIPGERLHDGHNAAFRYNKIPKLPLIKSPTLLIKGSNDDFVGDIEYTKTLMQNCETLLLEGGGVLMGYEIPEKFSQVIIDFLGRTA